MSKYRLYRFPKGIKGYYTGSIDAPEYSKSKYTRKTDGVTLFTQEEKASLSADDRLNGWMFERVL